MPKDLTIRKLPHVTTLVFEQENRVDTSRLLRLLADYLDASNGTLQNVTFHNAEDGGSYREQIVAHVEAAWMP